MEGEKKFPFFSRRCNREGGGEDTDTKRTHRAIEYFHMYEIFIPEMRLAFILCLLFSFIFFFPRRGEKGMHRPWMDAFIHPAGGGMGRTDYARELNLRRFTPRSSRLWGYFAFRCARVYVCAGIYIFSSLSSFSFLSPFACLRVAW